MIEDNNTISATARLRLLLPYVGIPILITAFFILYVRQLSVYMTLLYVLMIAFGYVIAVTDLKTKKIPNRLILAMFSVWVLIVFPLILINIDLAMGLIINSVVGMLIGGGVFLLVYIASRKGLGGGDVKFMAAAGLYIGFGQVIPAMLYGTVLAALTGITLMLFRKLTRKDTIPLAPFLYIGILLAIFWQ